MNTQIYLMLVRKINPNLPTAVKIPLLLKNFVMGDSLDAPFIKFIRVQSVSHSIGFGGGSSVTRVEGEGEDAKAVNYSTGTKPTKYGDMDKNVNVGGDNSRYVDRWEDWDVGNDRTSGYGIGGLRFFSGFKNNDYLNISLPEHNELTFKKYVDNATPQLAYGCSAQEPYYFAAFFYRRKIGAGIKGVRLPFMGIGLTKCLITGWSLDDEMESVTLKYKNIMWGTFDQLADINAPTGMSYRVWDTDNKEGGETTKGLLLQGLIAGLTAAGAAAVTAITGGFADDVTKG